METWDYLIVTAANQSQAEAYEHQLQLRQRIGLLQGVEEICVIPDPEGRRIGSGGSTLYCLVEVLNRHLIPAQETPDPAAWMDVLSRLRILIVHAGGDSKRLPIYSPCGKIFVPMPGTNDTALPLTLFDRQIPTYLALPASKPDAGQVVIAAGDVLLQFSPETVRFKENGLTGLGSYVAPDVARHHGVYCLAPNGDVQRFLQKPPPALQQGAGAVNPYGQSILDIGVMNFDARTAAQLLGLLDIQPDSTGKFAVQGTLGHPAFSRELDFYREICAALGSEGTETQYIETVRDSGSVWDTPALHRLFHHIRGIPFHVDVLPQCDFLHFGTTRQIITSGQSLVQSEGLLSSPHESLSINNATPDSSHLRGQSSWIEGCRIRAPLTLGGNNVAVGLDIDEPLSLPASMAVDVLQGRTLSSRRAYFVRCYGVMDSLHVPLDRNPTFCGIPLLKWLKQVRGRISDLWDADLPADQQTLWHARLFPAVDAPEQFRQWLWMFDPSQAGNVYIKAWHAADRYSSADIARYADHDAFHQRRAALRSQQIQDSFRRLFRPDSTFSQHDFYHGLIHTDQSCSYLAAALDEAAWCHDTRAQGIEALSFPRILHTLSTSLQTLHTENADFARQTIERLQPDIAPSTAQWLNAMELNITDGMSLEPWINKARVLAFKATEDTIVSARIEKQPPPHCVLRSDEIIWGRAPARFDTGGGWTDTPPYSLEQGGSVLNMAIDLNGQPPIQAYLRIIKEPVIRLASIDLGTHIEITDLDTLLDYCTADSAYALTKAALVLSGFSPDTALWPTNVTLAAMLEQFGGGIELTTLAAIPKGSGLGTSSIMGAVVLSVIQRSFGVTLTQKDLFHSVLCLEQLLTTGGGWQDQIGGVVGGIKIIHTDPGLVPDPTIHYLPHDLLEPELNGGQTLLYYTGITRLAKNILAQVVGRYLDRDRHTVSTLKMIHQVAKQTAEALSRKDLKAYGEWVAKAWQLNKQLDPNSTNPEVEEVFQRIQPHVHGAKLLGAGGGGFLFMVCKSVQDAHALKAELDMHPTNERARFFRYNINTHGLTVTVC